MGTRYIAGLALVAAAILAACSGGSDGGDASTSEETTQVEEQAASPPPTVSQTVPQTPEPTAVPEDEIRLTIPKILVDAPVSVKAIDETVLPDPDGLHDAVAYDLSVINGNSGDPNSGVLLMHGRLDSGRVACFQGYVPPPCFAVFGSLEELSDGDELILHWLGEKRTYRVNSFCWYEPRGFDAFPVEAPYQALALMTQAGNFIREGETGRYSHFLVVWAFPEGTTTDADCRGLSEPPAAASPAPDLSVTPPSDVTIESLSSPVSAGKQVTLSATANPSSKCSLEMRWSDVRVLGFSVEADASGDAEFVWRVPDHYPSGEYLVVVNCGSTPAMEQLALE